MLNVLLSNAQLNVVQNAQIVSDQLITVLHALQVKSLLSSLTLNQHAEQHVMLDNITTVDLNNVLTVMITVMFVQMETHVLNAQLDSCF